MTKTSIKLVGFVDILGFSSIIEKYDKGELPNILTDLKDAVGPAASFLKQSILHSPESPFFDWKKCLDARLFSDCLCVSAPLEYKEYGLIEQLKFFYKYLMGYQIVLMDKGFFTRGAVTIGSHYADENMIFSGGLVEAYKLETKRAKYPRIILSERLLSEIETIKVANREDFNLMLVKDEDGEVFFNHFNYNLLDSEYSDRMAEQALGEFGFLGIIEGSFVEMDIKEKANELQKVQTIIKNILTSELELNHSIKEKYDWLLDFINSELGLPVDRKFYKI